MNRVEKDIKAKALSLGFSACGIASAAHLIAEQHRFEESVRQGFHADMKYLERDISRRFNPTYYFSDCQSVVVCIFHYPASHSYNDFYKIARYAHMRDYHLFMKEMLEELALSFHGSEEKYRITVDTAPVTEKNWAVKAGLGSIGKNTLFRSDQGSFCLIGTILTTRSLKPDSEKEIPCGSCDLCVKACPTGALTPFRLDCSKCVSYLTTEHKGEVPSHISRQSWIFGCDICQEVCPHNKVALERGENTNRFSLFSHLEKERWENMTEEEFGLLFKDSPIMRRGFKKLKVEK